MPSWIVEPQTNIKLLSGVPLDNTYEHTVLFNSVSEQASYFASKTAYDLSSYTYQRVSRGVARVGINAEAIYNCNYMMFRNNGFGNKWFYAFITDIAYVNTDTTEISFELDVMQTWAFDYDLEECFVEREHTTTDTIGSNILPEDVDTGEAVCNSYGVMQQGLSSLCVLIMCCDTLVAPPAREYNRMLSGATLYAYNVDDSAGISTFLNTYKANPDNVIAIYMCPRLAVYGHFANSSDGDIPVGGLPINHELQGVDTTLEYEIDGTLLGDTTTIDTYTPKNKKLLTYPYNYMEVITNHGSKIFRYEFFDGTPKFKIGVGILPPVQCSVRPIGYKHSNSLVSYYPETIILDDYPMCSWNNSTFMAWLAQNSIPIAGGALTAGVLGALAVASPLTIPTMGVVAGVGAVTSVLHSGYKSAIASDRMHGNINGGNIDVAQRLKNIFVARMSVSLQYARAIDDYFTKFGYACRRIKKPNRDVRPHWTYTKTISCTITGNVPAPDMKKICSIYDAGVTFWKNPSEVGLYSLDNSPITD